MDTILLRTLALLLVFAFGFLVSELELHRALGIASARTPTTIVVGPALVASPRPTPVPVPTGAPVDATAALSVRSEIQSARDALIQRAPMRDLRSFHRTMPQTGAGIHALATKYAHAIVSREQFVLGVVGSSNAACHDNEVRDCFPSLLADSIGALLRPLGVSAVVRNHAMGSINSILPSLCLDTIIGDDVDVLFLEFLMTDAGMTCAPASHEMLVRRALLMPKQPALHFVEIEGGRRDFNSVPFDAATGDLDGHYQDGSAGYFRPLREHYADFDVHHMQMLDGLYHVDHVPEFRYETLFVTHHPGPAGHRFIADQLLFYHYEAILVALDLVADAPNAFLKPRRRPLPAPLFCGEWCKSEQPPMCLSSFQPRFRVDREVMSQSETASYVRNATEALALAAEKVPAESHEWRRVLAANERLNEQRDYLDFKLTWQASIGAGVRKFVVAVPHGGLGVLVVCRSPPPWDRDQPGHSPLSASANVRYTIDQTLVEPRDPGAVGTIGQCGTRFSLTCVIVGESLSEGSHTLSIEPLTDQIIDVSQVIAV